MELNNHFDIQNFNTTFYNVLRDKLQVMLSMGAFHESQMRIQTKDSIWKYALWLSKHLEAQPASPLLVTNLHYLLGWVSGTDHQNAALKLCRFIVPDNHTSEMNIIYPMTLELLTTTDAIITSNVTMDLISRVIIQAGIAMGVGHVDIQQLCNSMQNDIINSMTATYLTSKQIFPGANITELWKQLFILASSATKSKIQRFSQFMVLSGNHLKSHKLNFDTLKVLPMDDQMKHLYVIINFFSQCFDVNEQTIHSYIEKSRTFVAQNGVSGCMTQLTESVMPNIANTLKSTSPESAEFVTKLLGKAFILMTGGGVTDQSNMTPEQQKEAYDRNNAKSW